MLKRGQITFFLVLGIIILLVSAGLFLVISKIKKAPLEVEEKEAQKIPGVRDILRTYVESCIEETLDPAVYLLAMQGGIIYPDEDDQILLTDYGMVNYAWLNGRDGISKKKMEADLADYLVENINFCLRDFETFSKQEIIIIPHYEEMGAEIGILPSVIDVRLDFLLEVTLPNGDYINLNSFSTKLNSGIYEMIVFIEELNFPAIDPADFINAPYRPVILPFDESIIIYSLQRNDPKEPLQFVFAVREDSASNNLPYMEFIPDKTFTVGDRWQEELSAADPDNDLLKFSSSSSMFPVTDDGAIEVEITEAGIFEVTFSVDDGRGGKDQQKVSVLVLK